MYNQIISIFWKLKLLITINFYETFIYIFFLILHKTW